LWLGWPDITPASGERAASSFPEVMLAEALVYLRSLAATPPGYRRYLGEAVGLWARGVRQNDAWIPHIAETRDLIDTTIDEISPRRRVAVLGSGPLFDVPVESLARTFSTVILIDRAHLSTIERRTRRYDNIHLEWRDLSSATTPDPLGFLAQVPELDWVISVNLLSQLGRSAPEGKERSVVEKHLSALAALPCPATLITDIDYRVVDKSGMIREEEDLMHGRAMPRPDVTWKWEVAPFGEESSETRRVHQVDAWFDWRKAHAAPPK
jgi:hypothetical protein